MIEELTFPNGLRLLAAWQRGDSEAREQLREVMDAAIAGEFDTAFRAPPPTDRVNLGGSVNMTTLSLLHDLYGYDSMEVYRGDADRYVRTTMMTRLLLGMNKMYISWAVYALAAEALGQETMYPDKFPPGADPDRPMLNRDNWHLLSTPDFDSGVAGHIRDLVDSYARITGMEPILQISAPYNMAADIYGQEPLLGELINDPEFANQLLDHIVDTVHKPWIDHHMTRHPNGWVELSDASGSPFFIGPENCKNFSIRAIRRLKEENPWGHRVYDANYRGDYVAKVAKKDRRSARKERRAAASKVDLAALTAEKHKICQDYVIRLHDDQVPVDFYAAEAIKQGVPFFAGVGSSEVDRNGIADLEAAKADLDRRTREKVREVRRVAHAIRAGGYAGHMPPWPGTLYFEDISGEASFDLVETAIRAGLEEGAL